MSYGVGVVGVKLAENEDPGCRMKWGGKVADR